jgi:hypothetical protein
METMTTTKEFKLPNKKVKVRPVLERARGMITDKNHEAYFLFGQSNIKFTAPIDRKSGAIVCPLTEEERTFFEDKFKSGMSFERGDLSPYKKHRKDKTWWETKEATVTLDKNERILDLSNPRDYLDYKILLSNKDYVAPDEHEMSRKATYMYAIVEVDYETKKNVSTARKTRDAFRELDKIVASYKKMCDFLLIFGRRVRGTEPANKLEDELVKIVDESPDKFMAIATDPDFSIKALIFRALQEGHIRKSGHRLYTASGDPMVLPGDDHNLMGAVRFLNAKQNQDILLGIEILLKGEDE